MRLLTWAIATVFLASALAVPSSAFASPASSRTGVIIPLYTYPGSAWASVIQAKTAHPHVPIIAVINPDNGPGASLDQNYASGIQALRSAGITVLGYVYTGYAARPAASVIADIDSYKGWYNVSGIFLDQMSNAVGHEGYYSSLNTYAKSLGFALTVGNPGANTIPSYVGTVDMMIIYESAGLPSLSALAGWHTDYAKSNFATISYGISSVNQTFIASASKYAGYVYLTSGNLPNPYGSLPSYFDRLVAALRLRPEAQQLSLKVNSMDLSGSPIAGLWTTIQSNGSTVAAGYTPLVFNGTKGVTYTVSMSNYKNYVFDHWSNDGSGPAQVTLKEDTTLDAYYDS